MDHRACFDGPSLAEDAIDQEGPRADDGLVEKYTLFKRRSGADTGARADDGFGADHRSRLDFRAFADDAGT